MLITLILLFLQVNEDRVSITNYSNKTYDAGKQNWAIGESSDGILYFGNHEKLLEYDGKKWKSYSFPNYTIRSLSYNERKKRLYAGGISEFGYFENNPIGEFKYISLSDSIKKSIDFKEIWSIHKIRDDIYFCSFSTIFRLNTQTNRLVQLATKNKLFYTFLADSKLFIHDRVEGLTILDTDSLKRFEWSKEFIGKYVFSVDKTGIGYLISTFRNGVYLLNGNSLSLYSKKDELITHKLNRALKTANYYIAGTRYNGIYIYDERMQIKSHVNSENGLNNNIKAIHVSKSNYLWAATNNGISKINLNSPFKMFREIQDQEINVFDIIRFETKLYLATSKGVFLFDEENERYISTDISSKTRSFAIVRNTLFIGTESNFYSIKNGRTKIISNDKIDVLKPSKFNSNMLILYSRSASELQLFSFEKNILSIKHKIPLQSKVRTITEKSDNEIWLGSGNNGLTKISYNEKTYEVEKVQFHDTNISQVYTSLINDTLYLSTISDGLFKNIKNDVFEKVDLSKQIFKNAQFIEESADGRIWFSGDHRYYSARSFTDTTDLLYKPFLTLPKSNEHKIYIDPLKNGIVWFGEQGQLIRYDSNIKVDVDAAFPVYVRKITLNADSVLFGGHHPINSKLTFSIDYTHEPIRFEYAAPFYTRSDKTTYSYKLNGFDNDWSEWSSETTKDYTGLYEGNYSFKVRAKNVYETISSIDTYSFTIMPPFYRTYYAYGFYLLFIGWLVTVISKKVALKRTRELEQFHRIELAETKSRELELHNKLEKQDMRARIAGDLHDEVGSNLNGIGLVSGLVLKQTALDEKSEKRLKQIKSTALESADAMRDIVWFINPENDTFQKSLNKMRHDGERFLGHLEFTFNLENNTDSEPNIDIRRNVYMFYKEAIQNIVKHSEATKVDIDFIIENQSIRLSVADNGKGFDVESKSHGNGLKNYNKRADKIGGKATITSSLGEGSKIELRVEYS